MRGVTPSPAMIKVRIQSFQLTRLMRGVTFEKTLTFPVEKISTHTPHARRDQGDSRGVQVRCHFNSHASCEA